LLIAISRTFSAAYGKAVQGDFKGIGDVPPTSGK